MKLKKKITDLKISSISKINNNVHNNRHIDNKNSRQTAMKRKKKKNTKKL